MEIDMNLDLCANASIYGSWENKIIKNAKYEIWNILNSSKHMKWNEKKNGSVAIMFALWCGLMIVIVAHQ